MIENEKYVIVISHAKLQVKCLNVRERVEKVEWNKKMITFLPLLSCESSVSVKENLDRKKKWLIDINFRHSIVSLPPNQDNQSSYLIYSNWVKSVRIRSCSGPHLSRIFRHSDWIRRLRSVCLQYFRQIYSLIGNKIEDTIFAVVDFFLFF